MRTKYWFDLIHYVPSTSFQLCRDGSSLVEPVLKPRSHFADGATVHRDAGQPVFRDAPGHISKKINCVLTWPTLPQYSPGPARRRLIPGSPRSTCSTVEPRFMPVYPGVRHGYMPVGPRLRPGVTLHYKFRIKTWSNVSFLLSLSHNSYVTEQTQIGLHSHIR